MVDSHIKGRRRQTKVKMEEKNIKEVKCKKTWRNEDGFEKKCKKEIQDWYILNEGKSS